MEGAKRVAQAVGFPLYFNSFAQVQKLCLKVAFIKLPDRAFYHRADFVRDLCGKTDFLHFPEEKWCALQGLNLRPLPCEGNALPLS